MRALTLLIGRIFIAGIFIWDATVMVRTWDETIGYMESFGLPGALLPLAALFQFAGGIALVIGLLTRPVAFAFAGYCVVTALVFHNNLGDANEVIQFGKDFAMAGGFLFLAVAGAGPWSLDARITSRSYAPVAAQARTVKPRRRGPPRARSRPTARGEASPRKP